MTYYGHSSVSGQDAIFYWYMKCNST
jgi:hypothetical protein